MVRLCTFWNLAPSLYGTTSWCFAKAWKVYGIHEGDEDKGENNWDLLGENDTSESTFCHGVTGGCDDGSIGTFTLKPMQSTEGYKHIRFIMTEGAGACSIDCFTLGGIDVYGIITNAKTYKIVKKLKSVFKPKIIKHIITISGMDSVV